MNQAFDALIKKNIEPQNKEFSRDTVFRVPALSFEFSPFPRS